MKFCKDRLFQHSVNWESNILSRSCIRNMIPNEIFAEDMMSTVIRYGLYIGAAFQLICLLACVTLTDEQSESYPYEKAYTDSDECSSEQSSPGHRATVSRARRHDKKKRR